jgi:hypothetical protein
MSERPRIVYCHCAYAQVVPADVKQDVLRTLSESETSFEAVADLCEMAARRDPWLQSVASGGPTRIAACYPRAVTWLFSSGGAPLPEEGVQILNMRTEPASAVAAALLDGQGVDKP